MSVVKLVKLTVYQITDKGGATSQKLRVSIPFPPSSVPFYFSPSLVPSLSLTFIPLLSFFLSRGPDPLNQLGDLAERCDLPKRV